VAPTTITSICLVLFALLVLGLTAYGYYLILWAGASVRDVADEAWDEPLPDVDAAVADLRRQIEAYERSQRSS
jgi:hypothetical protein